MNGIFSILAERSAVNGLVELNVEIKQQESELADTANNIGLGDA